MTASHTQHVWQAFQSPWFHRRKLGEKQRQMNFVTPKNPKRHAQHQEGTWDRHNVLPVIQGKRTREKRQKSLSLFVKVTNTRKTPFLILIRENYCPSGSQIPWDKIRHLAMSVGVKLNPWKTAIMCFRVPWVLMQSIFLKDKFLRRKAITLSLERWEQHVPQNT